MMFYIYDEQGLFKYVDEAFLDPEESKLQGKDVYLTPPNSTTKKPLENKEGFFVKFNGDEWVYEEIPKEPEPPEPTLDELKTDKLNEVTAWTEAKITGGFIANVNGKNVAYDSDKETQLTVQGILLNGDKLADYYPTGAPIRGVVEGESEKTIQWLSAEQLFAWQAALSLHVGMCKQQGWQKQTEVANATTKEELDAIVLN